jgi:hypothetical protein
MGYGIKRVSCRIGDKSVVCTDRVELTTGPSEDSKLSSGVVMVDIRGSEGKTGVECQGIIGDGQLGVCVRACLCVRACACVCVFVCVCVYLPECRFHCCHICEK